MYQDKFREPHIAHEAPAGPGQHGQREQVEVEGVRLVLAAPPQKTGQPKLGDKEALRPVPVLQPTQDSFTKCLYLAIDLLSV